LWLAEANTFGSIGEVSDLDSDLIILIDFDILEDNLSWDNFEALGVDSIVLGVILPGGTSGLRLHNYIIVSYINTPL